MCNCKDLPEIVVDVDAKWLNSQANTAVKTLYTHNFRYIESEGFEPPLNYSESHYRCLECDQKWYIECAPEQVTFAEFAIQYDEAPPSEDYVRAQKQFLTILSSNGLLGEKCRISGCENYKLRDMELCHVHGNKF